MSPAPRVGVYVLSLAMAAAGCVRGVIGDAGEERGGFAPAGGEIDALRDSSVAPAAPSADASPAQETSAASDASPAEETSAAFDAASDTHVASDSGATSDAAFEAPTLVWRKANLTWYTSYPDPGSEECIEYSGCTWAGQFAALPGVQPESWVKANDIAAVHGKDFETYKLKTLRLRQGTRQIDVKVYDMCADSDCSGCCTKNSSTTGFLIDIEKYTAERFGTNSGIVDWTCLDC